MYLEAMQVVQMMVLLLAIGTSIINSLNVPSQLAFQARLSTRNKKRLFLPKLQSITRPKNTPWLHDEFPLRKNKIITLSLSLSGSSDNNKAASRNITHVKQELLQQQQNEDMSSINQVHDKFCLQRTTEESPPINNMLEQHQENATSSAALSNDRIKIPKKKFSMKQSFDLTTALFCAGLAFDAYSEPSDSSRWEKGVSERIS